MHTDMLHSVLVLMVSEFTRQLNFYLLNLIVFYKDQEGLSEMYLCCQSQIALFCELRTEEDCSA